MSEEDKSKVLEIGDEIEHLVTKKKGIAVAETSYSFNVNSFAIQPQSSDEKDKIFWVEAGNATILKKEAVKFPNPAPDFSECQFKMGDKVKEPISGFEGIVQGISRHNTGCLQVGVRSSAIKDENGHPSELYFGSESAFVMVDVAEEEVEPPSRGGPVDHPHVH